MSASDPIHDVLIHELDHIALESLLHRGAISRLGYEAVVAYIGPRIEYIDVLAEIDSDPELTSPPTA